MRLHIMLAEDDAQKRIAVMSLLEECGVETEHVVQVNDLRAVVRQLARNRFDILIRVQPGLRRAGVT